MDELERIRGRTHTTIFGGSALELGLKSADSSSMSANSSADPPVGM